MWRFLMLRLAVTFFIYHCACAVDFSIDLDVKNVPGDRSTCGVLHCVEEGRPPTLDHITSMTVSRRQAGRREIVASVSQHQPNVSRLWDDVKVDGTWSSRRAEVTLYLVEAADCEEAEFSCRVRTVDALGRQRVGVSKLGGAGLDAEPVGVSSTDKYRRERAMDSSAATSALQLSAMIQQVHASMESTVRYLQDRLEDSIRSLGNRLEDKVDSVRDTLVGRDTGSHRSTDSHGPDGSSSLSPDLAHKQPENASNCARSLKDDMDALHTKVDSIASRIATNDSLSVLESQLERSVQDILAVWANNSDPTRETPLGIGDAADSGVGGQGGLRGVPESSVCARRQAYHVVSSSDQSGPYLCDAVTDGGGWTVIQRRITGDTDFYRGWEAYKRGFGSLFTDFWLGNERIHAITSKQPHELYITLRYQGKTAFAHYSNFSLEAESDNYRLRLGTYNGTAGDSLDDHRNMAFSTFDKDNDKNKGHCAQKYTGAWWYNACHKSNLNGNWGTPNYKGPRWEGFTKGNPVSYSEMKIRHFL